MASAPTLVIQLQRMGDLIMTFPLITRLLLLEPERPLWVMAEPRFFNELMPLTPTGVVYMGPDMAAPLAQTPLRRVINLSHRTDARILAGNLLPRAELGVTGIFERDGEIHTRGSWALYRQSIVHNNRHNLFHWADLHALGVLSPERLLGTAWPDPATVGGGGKIGLFVSASEPEKRPEAAFWGELAQRLYKKGLNPVFLGGPEDRGLAHEANLRSGLAGHNNLAGQFSLSALTTFVRELDLVVTPDTGPMHLSAWAGVPVLNLSMGPVNPWETGPVPSGHWVLRTTGSCSGCWHCSRNALCRRYFVPKRVATLIAALLRGDDVQRFQMPGLLLCRTARQQGLYDLKSATPTSAGSSQSHEARVLLGRFWKAWYLEALGGAPALAEEASPLLTPNMTRNQDNNMAGHHYAALQNALPHLHAPLLEAVSRINSQLSLSLRKGGAPLDTGFWNAVPPLVRPLSGYLHLLLQNGGYQRPAWENALDLTAHLTATLEGTTPETPVTLSTL